MAGFLDRTMDGVVLFIPLWQMNGGRAIFCNNNLSFHKYKYRKRFSFANKKYAIY